MSLFFGHHIIPARFRNHKAFVGIDKKVFDIDSPANLIYLPKDRVFAAKLSVSPHPGRHVSVYEKAICKALNEIAVSQDPNDRAAQIRELIDAMRIGFMNGDLYTNMPIDKSREDVDNGVTKVFDRKKYLGQYPDQLKTIRGIEQKGTNAGLDHLIKWLLYLENPGRQKHIDQEIEENHRVNITARNKDLKGTWLQSKFAVTEDNFHLPTSTPADPGAVPSLPPSIPPSLRGLNEPEGFTRGDSRFSGALPAFPSLDPNEQRQLGQLPPTTAAQPDPLVLRFDPMTGAPLPFHENPLGRDASASGSSLAQDMLPWLAGGAAVGVAAPFFPAWLAATLAFLALTSRAANAKEPSSDAATGIQPDSGGVFSTGAPSYNAFGNMGTAGDMANGSSSAPSIPGTQPNRRALLGQEAASAGSFADRFGNWVETPAGIMPVQNVPEGLAERPAGVAVQDDVRRLARVNASNAGSVFASGSTPVPYLPPGEFSNRLDGMRLPISESEQQRVDKPSNAFADEPRYIVPPPPIFGTDNLGDGADEWFSRWVRPFLRPE